MSELDEIWRVRNAAATTLALCEAQMRRSVCTASLEQLVALIETFSPARSTGPEWARSFEPLVTCLRAWCDETAMTSLAGVFRTRGVPWVAVANALSPGQR